MCLGFPGRVVSIADDSDVASVEVDGAARDVNIALLREQGVAVGDWVLIHLGFALEVIDEAGARQAMDGLRMLGEQLDGELEELERRGTT